MYCPQLVFMKYLFDSVAVPATDTVKGIIMSPLQGLDKVIYHNKEILLPIISRNVGTLLVGRMLLLFSHEFVSKSLPPHGLQHTRLSCLSMSPRVFSNSCPLSHNAIHLIILCHPILFLPSVFPSIRVFFNESAFCIRGHILELQLQNQLASASRILAP